MRALVVSPPKRGIRMEEVPEPVASRDEVKVRVIECGVCGTDRDIVSGKYGSPPEGRRDLILGHENLGRIVEVGADVKNWQVGDEVVATVRRGCGICWYCRSHRSDFCETGLFTERGIKGRDGYLAEYYTERPEYLVRVPRPHRLAAVLLEPLSVVEKAVSQAKRVMDRTESRPGENGNRPRRALVAGTGAIGMLATLALRADGFDVTTIDRHDKASASASMLETVDAHHVDVSGGLDALGEQRFDLVLEATGSAALDIGLVSHLGPNGVLLATGLPADSNGAIPVRAGELFRRLVLLNQALVGSVNANRRYFEHGLRHLTTFRRTWGTVVEQLVSRRLPWDEYATVLGEVRPTGIKTVLTVGN